MHASSTFFVKDPSILNWYIQKPRKNAPVPFFTPKRYAIFCNILILSVSPPHMLVILFDHFWTVNLNPFLFFLRITEHLTWILVRMTSRRNGDDRVIHPSTYNNLVCSVRHVFRRASGQLFHVVNRGQRAFFTTIFSQGTSCTIPRTFQML